MRGEAMMTDQHGPASYEFSYFFGKEEYRSYVTARRAIHALFWRRRVGVRAALLVLDSICLVNP